MRNRHGFTLLELVATIAILGVLAVGMFGFIQSSTKGYIDFRNRDQLQSQARFAVERIAREIRHAVPNSLIVSGPTDNCLQYTPIVYPGMYNDMNLDSNQIEIAMSTLDPDWATKINDGQHHIVFDPMTPEYLDPSFVPTTGKPPHSYAILSASGNQLTLNKEPKALWPVVKHTKRFYIYNEPVTFCFQKDSTGEKSLLTRRVGKMGPHIPLAENVSPTSRFAIEDKSLSNSNLIHVYYKFEQSGEVSVFNQQIQVLNVP